MTQRGVHFALRAEEERRLLACPVEERPSLISDDIEETYFEEAEDWTCETDMAWEAIHRAFNWGDLDYEYRSPLHGVILGGERLYFGDDYIISLKHSERVREIAAALKTVSKEGFRPLYFGIDPVKYGFPLTEEDFEYSWGWLQDLGPFYLRAAEAGRSVVFTTDQ
ncbi:MAG: YfbM family protein [Hyphomicrobiaceae bacterium]|nr:YfbM family protein [Hyphomicrobiaceae bacterium]